MAIYQYYLGVIPKKGLLEKHNEIPEEIIISTETGYFESEMEEYWKLINYKSKILVKEIDDIIQRANWGNDKFNFNWKEYKDKADNDVWMSTNKVTGNIEEFSFRADLREDKLVFLKKM